MITYIPYIYTAVSSGVIGAVAMSAYSTCKLAAERKRTIEAQRDKETAVNSLIACRSTCDILKAKNEELRQAVDRIQAERDTLKAEKEQLLMDRANYRQAVEDRDTRIRNLETRFEDADARRIAAERKAKQVNNPETVETVGQAMEKITRNKIMQSIVCVPDDWHNCEDLAWEVGTTADIVEVIIKKEPARCIKSRYNSRRELWEFQIVPEHMYDILPTA